jgi:hypothetical protein
MQHQRVSRDLSVSAVSSRTFGVSLGRAGKFTGGGRTFDA